MRRLNLLLAIVVALAIVAPAATAYAQARGAVEPSTVLGVSAGTALTGDGADVMAGATAGWRLGSRVAGEARMTWFDGAGGDDTVAATLSARVFFRTSTDASPFVRAGMGMHMASFSAGQSEMPEFFRRRLRAPGAQQTFRDPAVVVGAGIDVRASRRFAIRPEIESMIVWRGGHRYVVTSASMQFSVLFERNNITPVRSTAR